MRRMRQITWLVIVMALELHAPGRSQVYTGKVPNTTQVNLEPFGWQRLPLPSRHEQWPTEAELMRVDSKGRVVIGYVSREGPQLAVRGSPNLSLHLLRFTQQGKLDLSGVSLPTDSFDHNAVFLDAEDHIFVEANGTLQMLTKDDPEVAKPATWTFLSSCSWHSQYCQIRQSPTRRTLLVTRCLGPEQAKLCADPTTTAYDVSSLVPEIINACSPGRGSVTDKFWYSFSSSGMEYFTRRYPLCARNPPQALPLNNPARAVLSDDLFVINYLNKKDRWEVGVLTANGNLNFRVQLSKHEMPATAIRYVSGDASGDRFAIVIDTLRGGNAALDIGHHLAARRVVVYSSESGTQLAQLSVYPPIPHDGVAIGIVPEFTFDLSPDGKTLAILSEGVITIAKVE